MYLCLRKSDIYEHNNTKVKFNPVKAEFTSTGDEFLIISNVDTNEQIKVTLADFRANYSLLKKSCSTTEIPFGI